MTLLLLAILLIAPAQGKAAETLQVSPPTFTAEEQAALDKGEAVQDVVVEGRINTMRISGLVEAPLGKVRAVVANPDQMHEWFPDMPASRLVSADGNRIVMYGETDLPWPLSNRNWQTNVHNRMVRIEGATEEAFLSEWTYIPESGNMDDNSGHWLLVPQGDATMVHYFNVSDLGAWAPKSAVRHATKNMLPDILEGLRKAVAQ